MKQKIALVTGAYGAIGRYVVSTLASDDWKVIGLGHGAWDAAEQANVGLAGWQAGDISLANLQALQVCPDLIVTCAGGASVAASVHAPHEDFERTVASIAAVLEFMRVDCPEATLVYPSSAAVYGMASEFPIREAAPLRPTSPYGVHKKLAEEMIAHYSKLFGFKSILVRLFSVYGEGFQKQLLWDACRRIRANETRFFGTGEETRDWLHVTDAAKLLVKAAESADASCPIINGAYGEQVSVQDVLTELFRLMDRPDRPQFSGSVRAGDPLHYYASVERALALGWQPQVTWKEGLKRYVSWFQQQYRDPES